MASWHATKYGGFYRESTNAQENAKCAYEVLYNLGWGLPAVCALLGNAEAESGYNPWRWQSDNVLASTDNLNIQAGHAYGFCQFDPPGKYINSSYAIATAGYGPNFSDKVGKGSDGTAQLTFINYHADYISTASYPISYEDFKITTIEEHDIDWMTHAWFSNYERGTWLDVRVTAANYWYDYLEGYRPRKIPIWLLFKMRGLI